jgi:hypothetical protein
MKIAIQLTDREERKALPILLRIRREWCCAIAST